MRTTAALFLSFLFSGLLFAQQPVATEHPLTNADVVNLSGLHLGDDVLIAKINQAPAVNFDVSIESLSKLQHNGVSSSVIAAMIMRTTPTAQRGPAPTPSPTDQRGVPPEVAQARARAAMAMGQGVVTLHTNEGDTELSGRPGEFEFKYYIYVAMSFMNYPGAESKFRTRDHRPSLLAHLDNDPNDKQEASISYLVKLDPSKRKDQRSLKVGQAFKTGAGSAAPDSDWILPYDSTQESPGVWRITPKQDLKPGEYGLYVRGRLYDFGVDQ